MHTFNRTIATSLADAAQAMGLDVVSALAAELSARMAPGEATARAADKVGVEALSGNITGKAEIAPELGDYRSTTFSAARRAEIRAKAPRGPTVTATISAEDDTGLDPEGYATEAERFDRAMARRAAEGAGATRAAWFEPQARRGFSVTETHTGTSEEVRAALEHVSKISGVGHLQPGDRLTFNTADGLQLFTVEVHRKG